MSLRPSPAPAASGTFTFLFSDLVDSTRLWEEHSEAMGQALVRHDALLRQAVESAGGSVFKTTGDGATAVFATAPDALRAALAVQIALLTEPWPEGFVLAARLAVHTGAAEARDGDYFGQAVNRAARLMAAGHGGQVLLSRVAYELCRDSLPEGASLLDLGLHRLKDLARPEQVFQLVHSLLRTTDLPPLRSLENPALPNNLPLQLTSFIGRERELAEARRLLTKGPNPTRLLTLTGSGGSGKSRLSVQAAADLLEPERFPDGAWVAEMAPLTDPALIPATVAQALGVREEPGRKPILTTLTEYLRNKRLLLLLDNCEHVLGASAQLAAALLRGCPGVTLLVTSREPLGVAGEQTFRVPSLSLPDPKQRAAAVAESLSQYEAVRLFVDRATAVRPDFAVTNQNAPFLAQLCWRLDGIPLAIELAAARIRNLSVEEINRRLDQRFRLLTGGDRTGLPHQQTLRALIDWSYDLLSGGEKALLHRLSVFSGGWTVEAAEQVCGFDPLQEWEVLDLLTSLADKSLALCEEPADGETRYRLLETVRAYAGEKLREGGEPETTAVLCRHQAFYLALAETAEPRLTGPERAVWLRRLEAEHDNLRAAMDGECDPVGALRLTGALWRFWFTRGHLSEGRRRLTDALTNSADVTAAAAAAAAAARAKALNGAGSLSFAQGDFDAADALHAEALSLRRELGDKEGTAASLNNLGNVAKDRGDYSAARALYEEALAIKRELGDRRSIAISLLNLGLLACGCGEYATARRMLEEALAILRDLGDRWGIAASLNNLGMVAKEQGEHDFARALYEEALPILRELGDKRTIAISLLNLGGVARDRGDYEAAHALCREALLLKRELGDRPSIAHSLEAFASLASATGQDERAARLWGAAEALREEIGAPLPPGGRAEYDAQVTQARHSARIGDDAFAAAWQQGRQRTLDEAVALALALRPGNESAAG